MLIILKREMLETLYNPRFATTFIVTALLIVFSIFHGYFIYKSEMETAVQIEKISETEAAKTESYQFIDLDLVRRPSPLTIFDIGLSTASGRVGTVSTNRSEPPDIEQSRNEENPVLALAEHLDLTKMTAWILSLIAIIYGHSAISGEREAGTLKMLTLSSAGRNSILFGKIIGNIIPLYLLLLLPSLTGILWLLFQDSFSLAGGLIFNLAGLLVTYLIYITVFYLLSLVVSTNTRYSFTSLTVCMGLWIALVILLPRLTAEVVPIVSPVPSETELEKNLIMIRDEEEERRNREIVDEVNRLRMTREEFSKNMNDIFNQMRHRSMKRIQEKAKQYFDEFDRKRQLNIELTKQFSRVTPYGNLLNAAHTYSGNGPEVLIRFKEALVRYMTTLDDYSKRMYELHKEEEKGKTGGSMGFQLSGDENGNLVLRKTTGIDQSLVDLSEMPRLQYDYRVAEGDNAVIDVAILGLYAIVLLLLAVISFQRYDVR